jgi:5-methylcytosine-specific restriction endonuclease McrA
MNEDDAAAEKRRKKAEYMRAYTARNAEKINAARKARRTEKTLARERAWRAANPDKVREAKQRDQQKRPDDYRRWKRDYDDRNRDLKNERQRTREALHREQSSARRRELYQLNLDHKRQQKREQQARRRARKLMLPSEEVDYAMIVARRGMICGICGAPVEVADFSIDHIIPLSRGGHHVASNLQVAHLRCNKAKGSKIL